MTTSQGISKLLISRFAEIARNERSSDHQWEHCFKYFSKKPKDHDLACLHLGFYLASWGMYRGSAKIREFDYLVHEPIVNEVLLSKYDPLRGASLENLSGHLDLVWFLAEEIPRLYGPRTNVTDTLLTKILMGTLGCTPAYDTYFKAGVSTDGICQTFSRKGFSSLLQHCHELSDGFREAQKEIPGYPVMRLVDIFYFAVGEKVKNASATKSAPR